MRGGWQHDQLRGMAKVLQGSRFVSFSPVFSARMLVFERLHAGTKACCYLAATVPSLRVAQEAAQSHHLRVRG